MRDLTEAQFQQELARRGWTYEGAPFWYVSAKLPGVGRVSVSILNAPRRTRRAQLAYLVREFDRASERH